MAVITRFNVWSEGSELLIKKTTKNLNKSMAKQTKYDLSFTTSKTKFIVSYVNGQLKRLEYKSGGFNAEQWKYIGVIVPNKEHLIYNVVEKYQGRVIYKKQDEGNPESQFKQFNGVYFRFFERETKLKPKFNAVEGAALKQIINYLNEVTNSEQEALLVWQQILSNWNKLDEFYQKQMLVRQINSNLSTIMVQLKNGTSNKTSRAKRNADDLRKSL